MNVHTNVQIIKQGDKPIFAVVPYDEWMRLTGKEEDQVYIPHEVVGYQIKEGLSLIASWRKFKGLTQGELAEKLGIKQPSVAQIEKLDAKPRPKTLKKISKALGVSVEQLTEFESE